MQDTTPSGCACHPSAGGELPCADTGPPPRQASPATPPQEGNCLVQIRGHHPVRLRLPPLHRRGIIRRYDMGWFLSLCRCLSKSWIFVCPEPSVDSSFCSCSIFCSVISISSWCIASLNSISVSASGVANVASRRVRLS